MAIPPRGDPRRPLAMAGRSCRLIGGLGVLLGTCVGSIVFFAGARNRGGGLGPAVGALVGLLFYGGGGAAFLVVAHFMKKRQFWAVVAALVITSICALFILLGLAGAVIGIVASPGGATGAGSAFPVMIGVLSLILLALGQLIYLLARSFAALRIDPPDDARGFAVLPVAVLPTDPNTTGANDGVAQR